MPGSEVRLFGSRARGTVRQDSDADLMILGRGARAGPIPQCRHHTGLPGGNPDEWLTLMPFAICGLPVLISPALQCNRAPTTALKSLNLTGRH
ncbi:nucleotidyltransferase domain-containing protein [Synechococcus sp. CS-1328]|nr:nucleotidyltransferase domain-containing protein [Synechococcus sp. CS-1328]